MRPLGTYRAAPALPEPLLPLTTLAHDLRWTWRPEIRALFRELDPALYERAAGNPIELLRAVEPARLNDLGGSAEFVARVQAVRDALAAEDRSEPRLPEAARLREAGQVVAYFCAEFGLTEILPIYSGGLGILAGDHLKSASDLGLPLVAVGLFYREGFFRQSLTADSRQKETYPIVNPEDLPLGLLETAPDVLPIVSVRFLDREIHVLVRVARVGRIPLLLLDSHLPMNRPADREITSRLYGGDVETRIKQEIVLGIGGLRALRLAGLAPAICHANEGHAAFLGLERIRELMTANGLSFDEAREVATAGNVFTTHTPVPAGIDVFTGDLVRRYLANEVEALGVPIEKILALGRQVVEDPHELFSMAVLGLRLSSRVNGVSKLHSSVSRRLWRGIFPEAPLSEMPIDAVTNGVHAGTWTNPAIGSLRVDAAPEAVDRAELWRRHEGVRAELVHEVRSRTAAARTRRGAPDSDVAAAWQILDPNALTITFARRFATYKRATLIFHDPERLERLVNDPERPVQLLFSGKAHPKDEAGKAFLQKVGDFVQRPELRNRVVLLENYDMRLARFLVSGSDVWLNNPRRLHEASGTSGMKAAMNGVLSLSVLDGWWDEAPRDGAGFTISDAQHGRGDDEVASALYERLEQEVIPLFYARDAENRLPSGWIERMIGAISVLGQMFSSDRMVSDYARMAYLPAAERLTRLSEDGYKRAKELAAWRATIDERFSAVGFIAVNLSVADPARLAPGGTFDVEVQIRLGPLEVEELAVDWFEGSMDPDGVVDAGYATPLTLAERADGRATYRGTLTRPDDDTRGYSVRLRPRHPDLVHPNETGLVLWAG